jgi:hypothetical protein
VGRAWRERGRSRVRSASGVGRGNCSDIAKPKRRTSDRPPRMRAVRCPPRRCGLCAARTDTKPPRGAVFLPKIRTRGGGHVLQTVHRLRRRRDSVRRVFVLLFVYLYTLNHGVLPSPSPPPPQL